MANLNINVKDIAEETRKKGFDPLKYQYTGTELMTERQQKVELGKAVILLNNMRNKGASEEEKAYIHKYICVVMNAIIYCLDFRKAYQELYIKELVRKYSTRSPFFKIERMIAEGSTYDEVIEVLDLELRFRNITKEQYDAELERIKDMYEEE